MLGKRCAVGHREPNIDAVDQDRVERGDLSVDVGGCERGGSLLSGEQALSGPALAQEERLAGIVFLDVGLDGEGDLPKGEGVGADF